MTTAREETTRLADLLRREHHAMADFLVALADFDRRRVWEQLGHRSLFYFLHRELGLPKGPAFYRKTVAELIERYPEVVEPLRDGRLCLSSIVEVAKVITPENRTDALPRFFNLSKGEAKEVRAELCPAAAPARRETVTPIRAPIAARPQVLPEEPVHAKPLVPGVASVSAAPASRVEPLTSELSRLNVTVTRQLLRKLDAARDALSHSHPGADAATILEVGLDLILERQAKRRGLVRNPRKKATSTATSTSTTARRVRYIPADVRRAVWERDGGCCAVSLEGGGVCGSTYQLELDHLVPFAKGGKSTFENLRVACRPHNLGAARDALGDDLMDRYAPPRAGRCSEPVAAYGAVTTTAARASPAACPGAGRGRAR